MLHIEINVKFRAFGFDIAKFSDKQDIALPAELQLITSFLGHKQFFTYNQHGVNIVLALVGAK